MLHLLPNSVTTSANQPPPSRAFLHSQFSFFISRCSFPISRFPFPVSHFPFPVPHSPSPVRIFRPPPPSAMIPACVHSRPSPHCSSSSQATAPLPAAAPASAPAEPIVEQMLEVGPVWSGASGCVLPAHPRRPPICRLLRRPAADDRGRTTVDRQGMDARPAALKQSSGTATTT